MICVCVFMYEWVLVVDVDDGVDVSGCMDLWFESILRASRKRILLEHSQWGSRLAFG